MPHPPFSLCLSYIKLYWEMWFTSRYSNSSLSKLIRASNSYSLAATIGRGDHAKASVVDWNIFLCHHARQRWYCCCRDNGKCGGKIAEKRYSLSHFLYIYVCVCKILMTRGARHLYSQMRKNGFAKSHTIIWSTLSDSFIFSALDLRTLDIFIPYLLHSKFSLSNLVHGRKKNRIHSR